MRHGFVTYSPNQIDTSNGQCFAELTVRARPPRKLTLSTFIDREVYRNPSGSASLEDIALRQFLRYIENVTPESAAELVELLANVPWTVGGKAWEAARKLYVAKLHRNWYRC